MNQDADEYMKSEVYPHVPDAIYRYEFDPKKAVTASNKERLGAEFPFTRYFYEYHEPEKADYLLAQFMELESSLSGKIAALQKSNVKSENDDMKKTGIQWIGEIPESWNIKRIKYMASLKGRIGWQGLTSEEYQDEGPFLITGVDFKDGSIDWENCYHIPLKRWEEAKEIQIQEGDLLITKDGTIGKVAIVSNLSDKASLNSGVLRIIPVDGYSRRFLYWVIQSEEFWNWFNYKNSGNSTIIHLYQGDFAEFIYAFPQYVEQELVADYLYNECGKLDNIIADLEKQLETIKAHKQSLIFEYVTGKKRLQEVKKKCRLKPIS